MICTLYLLVDQHGTKTKQWVILGNGRAFPEVLINLAVAKRLAWLLSRGTSMNSDLGDKGRKEAWEKAERELVSEVAASLSVPKCPIGRSWTGAEEIGFKACVRCPHLQLDEHRSRGSAVQDFRRSERPAWECGQVIQEVRVARQLADR